MSADGLEQRTAELDERIAERVEDEELDIDVIDAAIAAERIAELKALLADIRLGAEMMLEPALGLKGAMLGYVREVRRVADAGRLV